MRVVVVAIDPTSSCDDMAETGASDPAVAATATAVFDAAAAWGETGSVLSTGSSVQASASRASMAGEWAGGWH